MKVNCKLRWHLVGLLSEHSPNVLVGPREIYQHEPIAKVVKLLTDGILKQEN